MFTDFATAAPVTLACPACGPVPAGAVIAECTTHHNAALQGEDFVDAAVNAGLGPVAAIALDYDLQQAEARIMALLDAGDIDGAEALATELQEQILAAHLPA